MELKETFLRQYRCEPPDYLPDSIRENWRFLTLLCTGKDRELYQVASRATCQMAALKIAQPGCVDNLRREYALLKRLAGKGIPRALGYREDKEARCYLLRAWREGRTLEVLVERYGPVSPVHAISIGLSLCRILDRVHRMGVIHCDIKPQNILLSPGGQVNLIDFGIARQISGKPARSHYAGSIDYAAPEQFGFDSLTPRTDIYAVGRLLLYLTTGSLVPQMPDVLPFSPGLGRIIAKCTRLSPHRRYTSAASLARALRRQLAFATAEESMFPAKRKGRFFRRVPFATKTKRG